MTAGNSLSEKRVLLAPEVDVDDLQLGQAEARGDERPRDPDRAATRRAVARRRRRSRSIARTASPAVKAQTRAAGGSAATRSRSDDAVPLGRRGREILIGARSDRGGRSGWVMVPPTVDARWLSCCTGVARGPARRSEVLPAQDQWRRGSRAGSDRGSGRRRPPAERIAAAIATATPDADQDVADAEDVGERQPGAASRRCRSAARARARATTTLFVCAVDRRSRGRRAPPGSAGIAPPLARIAARLQRRRRGRSSGTPVRRRLARTTTPTSAVDAT